MKECIYFYSIQPRYYYYCCLRKPAIMSRLGYEIKISQSESIAQQHRSAWAHVKPRYYRETVMHSGVRFENCCKWAALSLNSLSYGIIVTANTYQRRLLMIWDVPKHSQLHVSNKHINPSTSRECQKLVHCYPCTHKTLNVLSNGVCLLECK